MQKTDRQVTELKDYSASAGIHISDEDIFIDIISWFSRLDRKPSNLFKSIEYYQGKGVSSFRTFATKCHTFHMAAA